MATAAAVQDEATAHRFAAERQVLKETRWVLGGPYGAVMHLRMKRSTLQCRLRKLGLAHPTCEDAFPSLPLAVPTCGHDASLLAS